MPDLTRIWREQQVAQKQWLFFDVSCTAKAELIVGLRELL
jgi:hypothetical protein